MLRTTRRERLVKEKLDGVIPNWRNHHHVTALYNSQKVTQGTIDLILPHAGKYHVVFNNGFSVFTPKAVEANLMLEYKLPSVETNSRGNNSGTLR
jgi:hypothetical protein